MSGPRTVRPEAGAAPGPVAVDGGPAGPDAAARALSLRLFGAMVATQESFTIYLGVRLGLYRALSGSGPVTAAGLAERTGLAPRYLREWLEQQAVAGILTAREPEEPDGVRRYLMPPGHERVLTGSEDPLSMVGTAVLPLGAVAGALPALVAAFRSGEGVPEAVYGDDWRHGHGESNRFAYTHLLPGWLRRYAPDAHRRLVGAPGRAADLGCGTGWSTLVLASTYPDAVVSAVDVDAAAIAQLRVRADDAGLGARIRTEVADAAARVAGAGAFDLVCVFDVLHEATDPGGLLAAARGLAAPGAPVLVLESQVPDELAAPGTDLARFQHATSVLHCLPVALLGATGPEEVLGTVVRPAALRALARRAGFSRVRRYELDDGFHRLYRLDE